MPVLYHVLYAVLALSGLKLTEGECFKPHILYSTGNNRADAAMLIEMGLQVAATCIAEGNVPVFGVGE